MKRLLVDCVLTVITSPYGPTYNTYSMKLVSAAKTVNAWGHLHLIFLPSIAFDNYSFEME